MSMKHEDMIVSMSTIHLHYLVLLYAQFDNVQTHKLTSSDPDPLNTRMKVGNHLILADGNWLRFYVRGIYDIKRA